MEGLVDEAVKCRLLDLTDVLADHDWVRERLEGSGTVCGGRVFCKE